MQIKLSFAELRAFLNVPEPDLPKYASQILNLANQNAQGTRPKVVGQMSELIQVFPGRTLEEWNHWYSARQPDALERATDRIYQMVEKLKAAMAEIDREMVRQWTEDLVIVKTFLGLRFHEAVLKAVADARGEDYRLASPSEESQGIDGYVGGTPVSIKPATYDAKAALPEEIGCELIYYTKTKTGIAIEL
jgi:hypothetical protein